jgi:hypothetical protein
VPLDQVCKITAKSVSSIVGKIIDSSRSHSEKYNLVADCSSFSKLKSYYRIHLFLIPLYHLKKSFGIVFLTKSWKVALDVEAFMGMLFLNSYKPKTTHGFKMNVGM